MKKSRLPASTPEAVLDRAGLERLEVLCARERRLAAKLQAEREAILAVLGLGPVIKISELRRCISFYEEVRDSGQARLVVAAGKSHFCLLVPGPATLRTKQIVTAREAAITVSRIVKHAFAGEVVEVLARRSREEVLVHFAPPTAAATRAVELIRIWLGPRTFV